MRNALLLVLVATSTALAAERELTFEVSASVQSKPRVGRVTATLRRDSPDEAVYDFVRSVPGPTARLTRGEAHLHKRTGGIRLVYPAGLAGVLGGTGRLVVDLPRAGTRRSGQYVLGSARVNETWREQDGDEIRIVSPKPYATAGPRVRFDATVSTPGAARVVYLVDDVTIAVFPSGGRHVFARALDTPGWRRFHVRVFGPSRNGKAPLLAEASVPFVARAVEPPRARGAIRTVVGANGPVRLNERTLAMLANARSWLANNGGGASSASTGRVVQGSYSRGVAASAGTHDGGGVIDLSVRGLDASERRALVRALREAGFAAWYRHPPAFTPHVHAVAIGDPDLSAQARDQVAQYFAGRDGLAGRGRDEHGGPIVKPWMARFR